MKRFTLTSLALVFTLFLFACGESNDRNTNDNSATIIEDNNYEEHIDNDTGNIHNNNDAQDAEYNQEHLGINNIADMNQPLTISAANRFGENQHTATISVIDVYRGDEARLYIEDKMDEAEMVIRAVLPEDNDGEDYLLVKFSFTLESAEEGDTASSLLMVAHSEELEPYPNLIVAGLYNDKTLPQLSSIDVSVGQTVTGYWFYMIDKADANPVVAYGNRLLDNSDGAWFKLT